ncbi:MAG: stage III sporulation protein AF [Firmicutes bacterium]|nr:stage III sporulation protein AF [Bacillota bacterium]
METLRALLYSLVAASLICAVLAQLVPKGGAGGALLAFVMGVFLLLTVLRPIAQLLPEAISFDLSEYSALADEAAQEGASAAREALREGIISRTQEYILDKAKAYGANLTVEVKLDDAAVPTPCAVTISGEISPYAKASMQDWIASSLGIEKEAQEWIS